MCSFPLQSGIHLYKISGCSVSCASKTTLEQTCSGAVVVHDKYLDVSVSVVSVGLFSTSKLYYLHVSCVSKTIISGVDLQCGGALVQL